MDNISNLTLGQIAHGIGHHLGWALVAFSAILNFEAIVRQVAVNRGYKNIVSLCDRIAGAIGFIIEVGEGVAKRKPPQGPSGVAVAILCVMLASGFTGCASGLYNMSCGHITANGSYATATGSGSGFACHAGYIGFGNPNYSSITTLATNYVNSSNEVTTTIPITVAVTPSSK